jgi:hypothetical protein
MHSPSSPRECGLLTLRRPPTATPRLLMPRLTALARACGAALLLAAAQPDVAAAQIAVIVHPQAPLTNVSLEDLRRYFLGKSTTIGSTRAVVVESTPSRQIFYHALTGLSEDIVHRRWVALAFRGEAPGVPRSFNDAAEVRKFVSENPGAIGFIDAHDVDASVKVLVVDGKRPSDAGYALR